MHGIAADLIPVLARVAVGLIRDAVQQKLRVHPLFGQSELHPLFLCIGLQSRRKLLRGVDTALRDKEKVLLMLHLRQRAVILQPAGEEPLLMGRAFHAGQAGVHVQRVRLRSLPGKVGAELHGCRQLRCLLLQHGLLGLQRLLQGLFPAQYRLDGRQRHIQHPQHTDKFKRADIPGSVIAVAIALPARRCEKSLFFIKTDVGSRNATLF